MSDRSRRNKVNERIRQLPGAVSADYLSLAPAQRAQVFELVHSGKAVDDAIKQVRRDADKRRQQGRR